MPPALRKGDNIATSLSWISSSLSYYISSILRLITKFVLRLLNNNGELERLLSSNHSTILTRKFSSMLLSSNKLKGVVTEYILKPYPYNVQIVANKIIEIKKINLNNQISTTTVVPNLHKCLTQMNGTNYAICIANQTAKIKYDSNNIQHEEKLELLWKSLCPGIAKSGRITKDWGDIGFQGTDPASDFRGMGILGLDCLLHFSTTKQRDAVNILKESNTSKGYPFAITGINLCHVLLKLIQQRKLDPYFFNIIQEGVENSENKIYEDALYNFKEAFCSLFERFNTHWWQSNPVNVLSFPPIFQSFEKIVGEENSL